MIPSEQPNAFATGRNPKNSAVAVTAGIMKLLSEDELRGVIAHELAHIRNRDILIQSVASTIGGAITYLAYMLLWFGGDDESPLGLIGSLAMVILGPDRRVADPARDLAPARVLGRRDGRPDLRQPRVARRALLRLEEGAKAIPMQVNQAAEPLYIVKPFSAAASPACSRRTRRSRSASGAPAP